MIWRPRHRGRTAGGPFTRQCNVRPEPERHGAGLGAGLLHARVGIAADGEGDRDSGLAVAGVGATDNRGERGSGHVPVAHREVAARRLHDIRVLGGKSGIRVIEDLLGVIGAPVGAGTTGRIPVGVEVLAQVGVGDPALGVVPRRQVVVGVLAALCRPVLERDGVLTPGREPIQPQPLDSRIPFSVRGVVGVEVALRPATAVVAGGVPVAVVVRALVVRSDRQVGERRRGRPGDRSGRGHVVVGDEVRGQVEDVGDGPRFGGRHGDIALPGRAVRIVDHDLDGLSGRPAGPGQGDRGAGRVVGLVAGDRGAGRAGLRPGAARDHQCKDEHHRLERGHRAPAAPPLRAGSPLRGVVWHGVPPCAGGCETIDQLALVLPGSERSPGGRRWLQSLANHRTGSLPRLVTALAESSSRRHDNVEPLRSTQGLHDRSRGPLVVRRGSGQARAVNRRAPMWRARRTSNGSSRLRALAASPDRTSIPRLECEAKTLSVCSQDPGSSRRSDAARSPRRVHPTAPIFRAPTPHVKGNRWSRGVIVPTARATARSGGSRGLTDDQAPQRARSTVSRTRPRR